MVKNDLKLLKISIKNKNYIYEFVHVFTNFYVGKAIYIYVYPLEVVK